MRPEINVVVARSIDPACSFSEKKKPRSGPGLQDGAGEEGRTPDLMLGKHTL
jgi:hypothetical protein